MNRIRFALLGLLVCLIALPVLIAGPGKIHFVEFIDVAGARHIYSLKQPVASGDALALRDGVIQLALERRQSQEKDADAFLLAATAGSYTDSGSLCYITARSGARVYYCGACGGLGCASLRTTIQ